jgi:uncharacterized Ntn-hydrolase superfamily protein
MTFSIVACDPGARPSPEWGVAVASKFLAVGAVVPWARAGAGAIATQALANLSYGPQGLVRLEEGEAATALIEQLTRPDPEREHRQVGVVDSSGRAASFTGSECLEWAGGTLGEGFCCQGNILAGAEVIKAMARAFEAMTGELAVRLLDALSAGDRAGGDRRGRQSAALLIVRAGGGYGGRTDRVVDLRVDDHPFPVRELKRIFGIHGLLFPRPQGLRFLEVDHDLAEKMRRALNRLGYGTKGHGGYDESLRAALLEFVSTENLEERWSKDDARVDQAVIDHLLGPVVDAPLDES